MSDTLGGPPLYGGAGCDKPGHPTECEIERLQEEIARLRAALAGLRSRFPATREWNDDEVRADLILRGKE